MSGLVRRTMAMFLAVASTGCVTPALWKAAGRSTMTLRGGSGVVVDPGGGRSLAVEYVDDTTVETLLVPLGRDGRPLPPYDGVVGRMAGGQPYVAVGADQARVLADWATGRVGMGDRVPGTDVGGGGDALWPATDGGDVAAIAYRFDAAGRLEWVWAGPPGACTRPSGNDGSPWTGTLFAVVPKTVPIAADVRAGRTAGAVALTPLAVAGDAGLVVLGGPFVVVYVVLSLTVSKHGFIWI